MKRILSFLAILFFFYTSQAQINSVIVMPGSGDTLVNAATIYTTKQVQQWYQSITIQAKILKDSGTIAGTAIIQGSLDGTNYQAIGTDTLTLSNTDTNSHIWTITGSQYEYYRLKVTGSGTMQARIYGYILQNK